MKDAMSRLSNPEIASYLGAGGVIGLSLAQVGVIVGIATAVLTFVLNALYTYRKDKREQRESDARFAALMKGRELEH